MRQQICGGKCDLKSWLLVSTALLHPVLTLNIPMLALPKKRPLFVEEEGGGGFWICDAYSIVRIVLEADIVQYGAYRGRARLAHAVRAMHAGRM